MGIVVVGSNMVDLVTYTDILPAKGETLEAQKFATWYGGKGANQAVAAAKLGSNVTMITRVGDDIFGKGAIKNLADNNINTEFIESVPGTANGVATIFVDSNAENRILIIKGANTALKPSDIDEVIPELKKAKIIILQLEIDIETVYHTISVADSLGVPVLLNPAPALKNLDINYISKVDFLVPNETELNILTGMPSDSIDRIKLAGKYLLSKGVKNVIVTLGSRGSLYINKKEAILVEAADVKPVDTTGAGDAFIGAFAHYYVHGNDIISAMKYASIYSGYSVTKSGTQISYPNKEEFNEVLKTSVLK